MCSIPPQRWQKEGREDKEKLWEATEGDRVRFEQDISEQPLYGRVGRGLHQATDGGGACCGQEHVEVGDHGLKTVLYCTVNVYLLKLASMVSRL